MGIFDFFGRKAEPGARSSSRDVARWARLAGEKLAQDYDRQEALAELGKLKTAEAAEALLRRFTFSMEPSITDQEEKETAATGIAGAADAALDPIRRHCAKAESLAWPLKP